MDMKFNKIDPAGHEKGYSYAAADGRSAEFIFDTEILLSEGVDKLFKAIKNLKKLPEDSCALLHYSDKKIRVGDLASGIEKYLDDSSIGDLSLMIDMNHKKSS
jgi:hypothetical protein